MVFAKSQTVLRHILMLRAWPGQLCVRVEGGGGCDSHLTPDVPTLGLTCCWSKPSDVLLPDLLWLDQSQNALRRPSGCYPALAFLQRCAAASDWSLSPSLPVLPAEFIVFARSSLLRLVSAAAFCPSCRTRLQGLLFSRIRKGVVLAVCEFRSLSAHCFRIAVSTQQLPLRRNALQTEGRRAQNNHGRLHAVYLVCVYVLCVPILYFKKRSSSRCFQF